MSWASKTKVDSTHISNAIFHILTDRYGDEWKSKVIGVGTKSGGVMIREHTNRPFIYGIHTQHIGNYLTFATSHCQCRLRSSCTSVH